MEQNLNGDTLPFIASIKLSAASRNVQASDTVFGLIYPLTLEFQSQQARQTGDLPDSTST
jgi:hypothetical protein